MSATAGLHIGWGLKQFPERVVALPAQRITFLKDVLKTGVLLCITVTEVFQLLLF